MLSILIWFNVDIKYDISERRSDFILLSALINPLPPNGNNSALIIVKISFKERWIIEKNSVSAESMSR